MTAPNVNHSHVRYSVDGTPVCWTSRNGTYHTPPVPAEVIAIDPPRHLSPIGATHPGTAANCLWCKGLVDDSAMERCGIDDSSHSEPGMQGGSRPAMLPKAISETFAFRGPPLWLGWFFLGLMGIATVVAIGACAWR